MHVCDEPLSIHGLNAKVSSNWAFLKENPILTLIEHLERATKRQPNCGSHMRNVQWPLAIEQESWTIPNLVRFLTRLRPMLPRGTSSVFNQSARKKKSAWLPLETFPVSCSILIGTERGLEKAKEFGLVHNSRLTFEKQDHLAWLWSADSTQRVPVITSAKLIALIFYACLQ